LKFLTQEYRLGVYESTRTELHNYPFILLAEFRYDLTIRLAEILKIIEEATKFPSRAPPPKTTALPQRLL